ncbi:MAG TPA: HAD-IA family hydrolase [Actinomycetales bacterium]|nr:HAD-IA family hydrolase [Actinomycetales bacterium]
MTNSLDSADLTVLGDQGPRVQPGSADQGGAFDGRTFDAVLFDLDGTLVDSGQAVRRSWVAWATENGVPAERLQGYHGMPAVQILAELVSPELVPAAAERLEQLEVGDVDDVVLLPGAARALSAIDAARCAIVTSCTAPLAAARIAAAGVSSPAVVVTASDVSVGKPDPAPFLLAAQRLGVDPARCLVVEDAVSGITAAKAAGMATLAVATTYAADALDADVVVPDLEAVRFGSQPGGVQVTRR